MPRRRSILFLVFLALSAALVACGSPTPPAQAALEYEATATSATSVRVVFSAAVDDASQVASNYAITHAGGPVQVFSAQRAADGRTVLLGTARLQDGVSYTLDVTGVGAAQGGALGTSASSFGGTSVNAPIVASAISLSSTEVLVHFADPPPGAGAEMSDMALEPRYYDIVEASPTLDETSDLTITSIRFAVDGRGGTDRTRVILTTEPQTDTGYTLRVTNVLTQQADKVLDPTNNTAAFRGIPANDTIQPTVTGATAIGNTEVLVDFSEPMVGADRADRYTIEADDGSPLEVIAAAYANAPYNTQVLLTTAPQRDELTVYTVTVTGVTDRQGNAIDPAANSAQFNGVFRTGPIDGDTTAPRVANTGSTGNTTVLVTFTEPIEQASAENAAHYRITARLDGATGPNATLDVLSATRSADRTTVTLTTRAQSDLLYTLDVTNVTDLAGNQIAPPELLNNPSTVTFVGTPPSGPQDDEDGDGLSDAAEQAGWFVTVRNADGSTRRYEVTSDPTLADTDGDGLNDLDERIYITDPRSSDTDGDGIDDWTELNVYYTEPSQQDTDGDGLVDGLETNFFGTSPLQADTDGDQIDDGDEVGLQNRNPLIADLPAFDLRVVGDVQLGLDVRFTAQSTTGSRVLETRSSQSTLSSESSRTSGSENAKATEWFINAGIKAGLEYEPPVSFKFTGEVSVDGGYKEATTTSFSSSSVQATQQAQAASLGTERELQDGETVTREVVGASMAVALELVSLGDVAFTVENLVITAKLVDPRDPTSFIPIATLTSTATAINLGPAPDARGPIRFTADDPAPALIEALRENPRNLLFEVANYDIVAEGGRNFTYTYQDVNDRTATFTFDYGGRRAAELYRVATPGTFDANGDPVGPALFELLEDVLDLEYV
ncbi:MAG: Ig-like domain-containing protein, partial [Trueperaceae bacterium]|nr:Ig-like domain-containing protein [Trueperaceae bacterium]